MDETDDLRAELADIAASLRAFLEQQAGTGAAGIPRGDGARRRTPGPVAVDAAEVTALAPKSRALASPPPSGARVEPLAADRIDEPRQTPTPMDRAASPPPQTDAGRTAHQVDRHVRLPALAREIAECTKCRLSESRKQTVFARGNPDASLCFIGEAPGADEDAQGSPFVGRAGQLLDRMIVAMGLSPERDAYVLNIIRCRPPENRRPEPEEVAACLPFLAEQLDLVRPKVVVALGNTAASALLGTSLGITKLRGQWKLYRGTTLVMPTYHPSYLLRPGAQLAEAKRQAWDDLQAVMRELNLPLPTAKRRGDTDRDGLS